MDSRVQGKRKKGSEDSRGHGSKGLFDIDFFSVFNIFRFLIFLSRIDTTFPGFQLYVIL